MYMFDLNAGLSVNSTEQKTLRVLMSFFGRYMYASNVKKKNPDCPPYQTFKKNLKLKV